MSVLKVGLLGRPNVGKSSLFNALSDSYSKTGNIAGVTLKAKTGYFELTSTTVELIDFPGIYDLYDNTTLTIQVQSALTDSNNPLDLILFVVDSIQPQLCFRLLLQLADYKIPTLIVFNKADLTKNQSFNMNAIARSFGTFVTQASRNDVESLTTTLQHLVDHQLLSESIPHLTTALNSKDIDSLNIHATQLTHHFLGSPPIPHERLDSWLLHPVWGSLLFVGVVLLQFQLVFMVGDYFKGLMEDSFTYLLIAPIDYYAPNPSFIKSILTDGMIASFIIVIGFFPAIFIFYVSIFIMEETGYMARIMFLSEKIMKAIDLDHYAIMAYFGAHACAIPAIISTRNIQQKSDRYATLLTLPLSTCSAKLPVYMTLTSAFIPATYYGGVSLQAWCLLGLYLFGIAISLIIAYIIKRLYPNAKPKSFILEFPNLQFPSFKLIVQQSFKRVLEFIYKAGHTIFIFSTLFSILTFIPITEQGGIKGSLAGYLGGLIQPIFAPIGFNWEISIALLPGLVGREIILVVLATIYGLSNDSQSLVTALQSQISLPSGLALITWYIFAPQCLATFISLSKESSPRLALLGFTYLLTLAYLCSFLVYQFSSYWV